MIGQDHGSHRNAKTTWPWLRLKISILTAPFPVRRSVQPNSDHGSDTSGSVHWTLRQNVKTHIKSAVVYAHMTKPGLSRNSKLSSLRTGRLQRVMGTLSISWKIHDTIAIYCTMREYWIIKINEERKFEPRPIPPDLDSGTGVEMKLYKMIELVLTASMWKMRFMPKLLQNIVSAAVGWALSGGLWWCSMAVLVVLVVTVTRMPLKIFGCSGQNSNEQLPSSCRCWARVPSVHYHIWILRRSVPKISSLVVCASIFRCSRPRSTMKV